MTNTTAKSSDLKSTLTAIRNRAAHLESEARAERLEADRALRQLARGTGDYASQAAAAVRATSAPVATGQTLAEKIEYVLRGPLAPLGIREIATAVGEPVGRVSACLRKLRATKSPTRSQDDADDARMIYNAGSDDEPRWIWVVGDGSDKSVEAATEELSAVVRRLLTFRAMTFSELTLATGARRGRLSGRLVQLQRDGEHIDNVGDDDRIYRWKLTPRRAARR